MKLTQSQPYLLIAALFLIIVSPQLLSEGMFMDGNIYAVVAKNMSEGLGTFWHPKFTDTMLSSFYEHPPLALGLEALLFRLFGDQYFIVALYGLIIYGLGSWVIVKIWRQIAPTELRGLAWLPLLFWFCLPLTAWSLANNMLENTLVLFSTVSVYFLLVSLQKKPVLYLALAAVAMLLGFLSKGPFALFPMSFFFWWWMVNADYSLKRFLKDTVLLILFFGGSTILMLLVFKGSGENLHLYYLNQIVDSFENAVTVTSRFHILERMLSEFAPALVLAFVIFLLGRGAERGVKAKPWILFFNLLGLSAVLPIMISLKQRGFYIIPALPLLSLALAVWVAPFLRNIASKFAFKLPSWSPFLAIAALVGALFLNFQRVGTINRDAEKIALSRELAAKLPSHTIMGSHSKLYSDWSLIAYLYRYGKISVTKKEDFTYYLQMKSQALPPDLVLEEIGLQSQDYQLYKISGQE